MSTIRRKERGWPGHYCMARACMFRRNTLVYDDRDLTRGIVVSTVGNMRDEYDKPDTIGLERYYETMAFVADMDYPYRDADVAGEVSLDCEWSICADSPESMAKFVDNDADDMHENAVDWVIKNFDSAHESGAARLRERYSLHGEEV